MGTEGGPGNRPLTNLERWFILLRRSEFFADFTDHDIAAIIKHGTFHLLKPFTRVVREGAEEHSFFIILDGRANVMKADAHGKQQQLATIQAGECFGEMALLLGRRRAASVLTEVETHVFEMGMSGLKELDTPLRNRFYYAFAVTLARRLKEMSTKKAG